MPPPPADDNSLEVAKAKFEILRVLKGADDVGKTRDIEAVYFGDSAVGTKFLIMGIDPPNINWSTPIAITDRGVEYVAQAIELPKEGAERLALLPGLSGRLLKRCWPATLTMNLPRHPTPTSWVCRARCITTSCSSGSRAARFRSAAGGCT